MTKSKIIKKIDEFKDVLNQFDNEFFESDVDDDLTNDEVELGEHIDALYQTLRRLRMHLNRME